MNVYLPVVNRLVSGATISITGSKSESNRLLVLQRFYPELTIHNISNSEDTQLISQALQTTNHLININHAGTAMRFLTAYFAVQPGRKVILDGSQRMRQRPIKILVDALKQLGAEIEYLEKQGFPPIQIIGKSLTHRAVSVEAGVSSQYLTALLLIAPTLPQGIQLFLEGEMTSQPYLEMTLSLLQHLGVHLEKKSNSIEVFPLKTPKELVFEVESDWSSLSYFYSAVALCPHEINLKFTSFKPDSLQGDAVLPTIYQQFGVTTHWENESVYIQKKNHHSVPQFFQMDLKDHPDIAQTLAVTCLGLGVDCQLSGLHTLKIKETDRLTALQQELQKWGAQVTVTDTSLTIKNNTQAPSLPITVSTYQDHRMAMAFAPLALKGPVIIEDAGVVAKSYPEFWNDFKKIGFQVLYQ